jgi:hypothetical protein
MKLIKLSLNETYSKVRIGKHLSHNFPIQRDAYRQVELQLNGTYQMLAYADDVNLLGDSI